MLKKSIFIFVCLIFLARTTPLQDVLQFKAEFEKEFGSVHPTFYQGSYSQVGSVSYKLFLN